MRIISALLFSLFISAIMTRKPIASLDDEITLQDQKPLFSFGIITDVQYCPCEPAGTRYYGASLEKLRNALISLKADNPQFIINLGDLIEKDYESYKPVMNILDSSRLKIYHVTGNHDYSVLPRLKKKIPPLNGSKDGYFSFVSDRFRFIALNGNEISTYSSSNKGTISEAEELIKKLKADGEQNGFDYNGGIGPGQMKWFQAQLMEASSKNEMVIIFCHFPVWPENVHNLLNYRDILKLLEKHNNIIAWFNGHNHLGNYGNFNMIHFVTMRGMVETPVDGSSALVEIYGNKIWIKGGGREKSQILAY